MLLQLFENQLEVITKYSLTSAIVYSAEFVERWF